MSETNNKYWSIVILLLSLYVLVQFFYELIIPVSPEHLLVYDRIDAFICFIFLGDYFYLLSKSSDKKDFIKTHWLDLISSIPFIELFRIARIARVIRIVRVAKLLRLARSLRGLKPFLDIVTKNKLRSIFATYIAIMVVIVFYCSIGFYVCEKSINDMVTNYFDAFWWSFITVTSAGYGDIYPKTTEGRILGMVLTLTGMGLFSLITAEISAKFVRIMENSKKNNDNLDN